MEEEYRKHTNEIVNIYLKVRNTIESYITYYNEKRFQKKLNNLTPIEYYNKVA